MGINRISEVEIAGFLTRNRKEVLEEGKTGELE